MRFWQQLAVRQLNSLGVQAEATVFGRDAIRMALSDKYDIVLMDINLPDITGLEATAAIRDLSAVQGVRQYRLLL